MGRRSFISMTAINRMISASNSRKREQQRIDLINSQSGTKKELAPTYSIVHFDFNSETRITKIEFLQSQQYRTIERYVTQNHVRYPIYSNWKTRTKTIKKSLKLTNQELESLNKHSDFLIRSFAEEIIVKINNEELLPSWFIRSLLEQEYLEKVHAWDNEKNEYHKKTNSDIEKCRKLINQHKTDISEVDKILTKKRAKRNKLNAKIQKIETAKKSVLKSIFTLFIYSYLKSERRKQKLITKKTAFDEQIFALENSIKQKNNDISSLKANIQSLNEEYSNKKAELDVLKNSEFSVYSKKLKEIQPLPCQISDNSDFIPLKRFIGLEYEKIVGCYIIHNKEKDKYYIGQSKDIVKRIRQHFKGTIPNNIIFAEDYYSASAENRENLFEIKIFRCETKDELDRLEKQLIEEYDAFNSGYNGTNGNT